MKRSFCNRRGRAASTLHMRSLLHILLICAALSTSGCDDGPHRTEADSQKLSVAVSVQPQRFLIERIGAVRVQVIVMVPPGMSPHSFEPPPSIVRQLERSTLYVRTGVEFEDAWLERFRSVNPQLRILDMRTAVADALIFDHEHAGDHDHGEMHRGSNPHIWLDPMLVSRQAAIVCEELVHLAPDDADDFRRRTAELQNELADLDRRLREQMRPLAGRSVIVFHPSWSYFARAYGFETIAIEENGREPGPKHLTEVVRRGRQLGLRNIVAQPEMSEH